ncbi:MAG: cytochrome-c peroxidase [Planctomycetota bacterium]|jgi:cytochrome c peroxidase
MIQPHHFASFAFLSLLATGATHLTAQSFPNPPTPTNNPTTADKVLLGKTLFWDEQLSSMRTVACGTCHIPAAGGSDPRALITTAPPWPCIPPFCGGETSTLPTNPGPDGLFGTDDDSVASPGVVGTYADGTYWLSAWRLNPQVTRRKTPTMINAAFVPDLFWDGRAGKQFYDPLDPASLLLDDHASLENQAAGPPVSTAEMAHMDRNWTEIAQRVQDVQPLAMAMQIPDASYPVPGVGTIPAWDIWLGSSSYQDLFNLVYGSTDITPARIIMAIAAYERTLVSDDSRFDRSENGGPPLTMLEQRGRDLFFGDAKCADCHDRPEFTDHSFKNIGVRPPSEDMGRADVTSNTADEGAFKVPGLRNVALRAPYMHNGRFVTLEDVVEFYERGGDFTNPELTVLNLSDMDKMALVAFMQTLTDERVAQELPPFDRPVLYTETDRVPDVYGTSSGAGGSSPFIIGLEPPLVGNPNWTLAVDGGPGGAHAFLVWGRGMDMVGTLVVGIRVHLDLSKPFRIIYAGELEGVGAGEGYGSLPLSIPNNSTLVGQDFYAQWLILDESGPFGLLSSDALAAQFF